MQKLFFSILFLTLFSSAAFAGAEDCPTLSANEQGFAPLHELQPGRGWCYAVITADLLSSESGHAVSAISIANKTERAQDTIQQKLEAASAHWLHQIGVASDAADVFYRFSPFGKSYAEALQSLNGNACANSILDKMRDAAAIKSIFLDEVFADLESARRENTAAFRNKLHQVFDSTQGAFAEALYHASAQEVRPMIDIAVDLSCTARIDIHSLKLEMRQLSEGSATETQKQISLLLSQHHAIGIGYDSRILQNPKYGNLEQADHASMLVGQFWDGQSCQYKIRATDLQTCAKASADLQCQDGYFSISREDLLRALSDLAWLHL